MASTVHLNTQIFDEEGDSPLLSCSSPSRCCEARGKASYHHSQNECLAIGVHLSLGLATILRQFVYVESVTTLDTYRPLMGCSVMTGCTVMPGQIWVTLLVASTMFVIF